MRKRNALNKSVRQKYKNGFDLLRSYLEQAINQPSEAISDILDECTCFDLCPDTYGDKMGAIMALQADVTSKLTDAYTQALALEDLQRKQAEAQAIIDREMRSVNVKSAKGKRPAQREKMRQEAEEAARLEVERAKAEAERQAREAKRGRRGSRASAYIRRGKGQGVMLN